MSKTAKLEVDKSEDSPFSAPAGVPQHTLLLQTLGHPCQTLVSTFGSEVTYHFSLMKIQELSQCASILNGTSTYSFIIPLNLTLERNLVLLGTHHGTQTLKPFHQLLSPSLHHCRLFNQAVTKRWSQIK